MWPNLETDILGDFAEVRIDPAVYSEAAIFKACYWMTDRHFVFLDREESGTWLCQIRNKPGNSSDLQLAAADFCNALIDHRLRDIVNTETGAIRDALVNRAFAEGAISSGLDGAVSDERHLSGAPR